MSIETVKMATGQPSTLSEQAQTTQRSATDALRPGLRPYRQGQLDALCGLYAIINAVRWATWPRVIEEEIVEALFARLSSYAVMELPLPKICSSGTTIPQLRKLLLNALMFIEEEYQLTLVIEAIPAKSFAITPDILMPHKITPTAQLGEAFILNLTYTIGHWSVFEGLSGNRLKLFDSAGMRTIPLHRVAFSSAFKLRLVKW